MNVKKKIRTTDNLDEDDEEDDILELNAEGNIKKGKFYNKAKFNISTEQHVADTLGDTDRKVEQLG